MAYLLDTVTVVRHLTDTGRIGKRARQVLNRIENGIDEGVISVVTLMEIMYLAERSRIELALDKTLKLLDTSQNYTVADLTSEIIQTASKLPFPELHDRLILATSKYLKIPILSSDASFSQLPEIQLIWN